MNLNQFDHFLKTEGRYQTSDSRPSNAPWRWLCKCDAFFYIGITFFTLLGGVYGCFGKMTYRRWQWISYYIMRVYEAAGAKFELAGFENFPKDGKPCVFVCNHMGMAETYLLPSILLVGGDMVVIVKSSLMKYPGLGKILAEANAIPVDRKSPRDDLRTILTVGKKRIAEGLSVLVFPQSTRNVVFDPKTFNSIGAKLAARSGVNIIPVAVKTDFQSIGKRFRDIGPLDRSKPILIQLGAPISTTEGHSEKEAHAESLAWVESTLRSWSVDVLEG
jgi:1-acyl-sn-glycerol-3-phosphate acyltransferase